jgi:hypothetical protein
METDRAQIEKLINDDKVALWTFSRGGAVPYHWQIYRKLAHWQKLLKRLEPFRGEYKSEMLDFTNKIDLLQTTYKEFEAAKNQYVKINREMANFAFLTMETDEIKVFEQCMLTLKEKHEVFRTQTKPLLGMLKTYLCNGHLVDSITN